MCYHVEIYKSRDEIQKRYGVRIEPKDNFRPAYYLNAFQHPVLPVLTMDDKEQFLFYRWGLIPHWIKDRESARDISNKTLNAVSETVDSKPSYRKSFESKRCLIPIHGFYEWKHTHKRKIPFYIRLKSDEIFSLAGLYDTWKDPETGNISGTFSVMTTRANPMMEDIHNTKKRMPVILPREIERYWIDQTLPPGQLKELLEPISDEYMEAWTIGPVISKPEADKETPEILQPFHYTDPEQKTLF